jgi:hypothetical protein
MSKWRILWSFFFFCFPVKWSADDSRFRAITTDYFWNRIRCDPEQTLYSVFTSILISQWMFRNLVRSIHGKNSFILLLRYNILSWVHKILFQSATLLISPERYPAILWFAEFHDQMRYFIKRKDWHSDHKSFTFDMISSAWPRELLAYSASEKHNHSIWKPKILINPEQYSVTSRSDTQFRQSVWNLCLISDIKWRKSIEDIQLFISLNERVEPDV